MPASKPRKAASKPRKAASKPRKATRASKPRKAASKPRKATSKPRKAASKPRKATSKPRKAASKPRKATKASKPRKAASKPRKATKASKPEVAGSTQGSGRTERAPDAVSAAKGAFYSQGERSGRAVVARYDGALRPLTRESAQEAVERILDDELQVSDAACEYADEIVRSGSRVSSEDLCEDLVNAYWRGAIHGAGLAHDQIVTEDYAPKSRRSLPLYASGGIIGRIYRAIRN